MKFKPSVKSAIRLSKVVSTGKEELLEDELLELETVDELLVELEVVDELLLVVLELLTVLLLELLEVESALVTSLVLVEVTVDCSLVVLDVLLVVPPGTLQAANETLANKTSDFKICFFIN